MINLSAAGLGVSSMRNISKIKVLNLIVTEVKMLGLRNGFMGIYLNV
jgi:hypothetical protein